MKRYILMIVALVLIVAAFISMPETAKPMVTAGAGNGKNAEIKNFDQLSAIFNFVSGTEGIAAEEDDSSIQLMSYAASTESEKKKYSYDSVTMHEETKLNSHMTYEGVATVSSRMNRSLTIYKTSKAVYYVSKGMTSYRYEQIGGNDDLERVVVFDVEFYMKGDDIYAKFNNFIYKENGENLADLSEIYGRWVKLEGDTFVEVFQMVNSVNETGFEYFTHFINEEEDFKKNGSVYTLETSLVSGDTKDDDTTIVIDLNSIQTPLLSLKVDYTNDNGTLSMKDIVTFSNVDNTVIEVDFRNAEKISEKEFNSFFKEADDD